MPIVATGDLFRAAVRDGTPLGIEARHYMDAGQLVPDEITVRLLLDRLARADADGGVILDGFPRTDVQARALDDALASRDSAVRVAVLVDVPTEELIRRMSGRWVCRAAGHPYHEVFSPPHVAGICDLDGSELYQRSDDRPETIRARMTQQLGALGAVVDHYRASGVLRTVNGLQDIDDVADEIDAVVARGRPAALLAVRRGPERLMHVTRKSKAEIAKMRSAGRIVAEVLALVEESLKPGVSTAELDRAAERHIRAAKAVPSFLNYLGGRRYDARDPHAYPASTCISIDNEIVHGIPGDREIKAGQLVSVDVGAIYDDWHGDGARTFICGGPEAATVAARGLVEATRLSLMAGIYAAQPGQLHLRHLGRRRGHRDARRLRHRPPVRRARDRHLDARGPAGPELPLALEGPQARARPVPGHRADADARVGGDPDARRRLDGRHLGRVAGRPLRAHDCRDRRRS